MQPYAHFVWNIDLENLLLIDFLGSSKKLAAKTQAEATSPALESPDAYQQAALSVLTAAGLQK